MPRRRSGPRVKKPKQAKFDLIEPDMKPLLEPYKLMKEIRAEFHPDTKQAKIALAWMHGVKANVDGKVCLGKCILSSELQKEFMEFDFVILLNKEVWESKEFGVERKKALLDHELMHAAEAVDKEGEPKVDAKGRKLFRIRNHDLEEFTDVVRRHGVWKKDLEIFAEAIIKKSQAPLFKDTDEKSAVAVN